MDASKIQAVVDWPRPHSPKDLRGFLGLAGYYRKFIQDFGTVAAPLTQLLRKDGFTWSPSADDAFQRLKLALTTAPVLTLPDFTTAFTVECDASGTGFGAVLHQGAGPIAYFSRPVAARHQALAAYERELIGLVQAVRHWRPYLWGRQFLVKTDHYSLKYLLDQRLSTIPQHHWVSKLLGFDFTVEYKPGKQNAAADALSRRAPPEGQLLALSMPTFDLLHELRSSSASDPALVTLRDEINAGTCGAPWALVDGFVTFKRRIYVPPESPWLSAIVAAAHDEGHEGIKRLCIDSGVTSTRLMTAASSATLFVAALSASATRRSTYTRRGCCFRFRCRRRCGPISPWTSSRVYRALQARPSY